MQKPVRTCRPFAFTLLVFSVVSSPAFADRGMASALGIMLADQQAARVTALAGEIDENPRMERSLFMLKAEKAAIKNSMMYHQIVEYYENSRLTAESPLELNETVLADSRYLGEVRYIFPGGKKAAVELRRWKGTLYTYGRSKIGKVTDGTGKFEVGAPVRKAGNVYGEYLGTIGMVFENGMAEVEYEGYEGKWYPENTADLQLQ